MTTLVELKTYPELLQFREVRYVFYSLDEVAGKIKSNQVALLMVVKRVGSIVGSYLWLQAIHHLDTIMTQIELLQ